MVLKMPDDRHDNYSKPIPSSLLKDSEHEQKCLYKF